MSWDEAFASQYEEWSADMTADVAFYVGLARAASGPLVELAVGNGRVAIPVAQATGQRVIGIDSSPAMLEQARVRAAEAGVELDLREGDMRDLALDEPAALIYCPFRALLHLPTWADRRRTFERVAASLRPDGRFAWNAFAFDHHIAAGLDGKHQKEPVPHTIQYAVGDNRIDIILDGGATSSLWWATKNEWLGLLTWPVSSRRRSTAALPRSHLGTTAGNTCSWPALGSQVTLPDSGRAAGTSPHPEMATPA
jgi:SAM-dependent methyltransferase